MEGAYINMKLIIGNRESGAGELLIGNRESETVDWFLVPYLSKRLEYFKTVDQEQGIGNRELVPPSSFFVYNTNDSKVQIGNKKPVPGSFLTRQN